jgi:hypothetical protein
MEPRQKTSGNTSALENEHIGAYALKSCAAARLPRHTLEQKSLVAAVTD